MPASAPRNLAERVIEAIIFSSRWLPAPFYVGLVAVLLVLLVKAGQELWHLMTHALGASDSDTILGVGVVASVMR